MRFPFAILLTFFIATFIAFIAFILFIALIATRFIITRAGRVAAPRLGPSVRRIWRTLRVLVFS